MEQVQVENFFDTTEVSLRPTVSTILIRLNCDIRKANTEVLP